MYATLFPQMGGSYVASTLTSPFMCFPCSSVNPETQRISRISHDCKHTSMRFLNFFPVNIKFDGPASKFVFTKNVGSKTEGFRIYKTVRKVKESNNIFTSVLKNESLCASLFFWFSATFDQN